MTFECTGCRARYRVDDAIIPPDGARVKCRRCGTFIVLEPPVIEIKPMDLEMIPAAQAPTAPPAPARRAFEEVVPAAPPPQPEPFVERFTAPAPPSEPSIERFAPTGPSEIPQDPTFERWGTPTPEEHAAMEPAAPREPARRQERDLREEAPIAHQEESAVQTVQPENVVPLSLGTPIPDGLSPEERTKHEKARRLARVLASDIAIYNREKKERGLQEGNLIAVLGYEIKKSWETYKERVGADFANSTPYFRDALNDLLAEGKKLF
jgi:predicted Zn finger-like uncharacterized protein